MGDRAISLPQWIPEEGLRFECTQCGACCTGPPGFVLFTEAEGRRIARRLGITYAEFLEHYTRETSKGRSLNERELVPGSGEFDCVFLDRTTVPGKAVCSLYEDRPTQCRTFPFWPEHLKSRRAWEELGNWCEGVGRKQSVSREDIVSDVAAQFAVDR